jgi:hypothetical protein
LLSFVLLQLFLSHIGNSALSACADIWGLKVDCQADVAAH